MTYQEFWSSYHEQCELLQDDPEGLEKIHGFGRRIAMLHVWEIFATAMVVENLIKQAKLSDIPGN